MNMRYKKYEDGFSLIKLKC